MVRICHADIGGGLGGDIGDHIAVEPAIVGVQPQVYLDVGIQRLKFSNGGLIDLHLGQVGIVLCPEGDLVIPGGVKFPRQHKLACASCAMAAGEHQRQQQ